MLFAAWYVAKYLAKLEAVNTHYIVIVSAASSNILLP